MKDKNETVRRQIADKPQDANELARELLAANKDGGAILLDDFCSQLRNVPRLECIRVLKNNPHGMFIVGRKGHKSRWVYGKMAQDIRSSSFSKPVRQAVRPQRAAVEKSTEVAGSLRAEDFKLRAVVNGQELFFSVDELELVPA